MTIKIGKPALVAAGKVGNTLQVMGMAGVAYASLACCGLAAEAQQHASLAQHIVALTQPLVHATSSGLQMLDITFRASTPDSIKMGVASLFGLPLSGAIGVVGHKISSAASRAMDFMKPNSGSHSASASSRVTGMISRLRGFKHSLVSTSPGSAPDNDVQHDQDHSGEQMR